jgi:hypothetical protein
LVIPAARVRVSGEGVRIGPPPAAGKSEHEPKVRAIQEGDAIRTIVVTCTCGEQIHIRCEYA